MEIVNNKNCNVLILTPEDFTELGELKYDIRGNRFHYIFIPGWDYLNSDSKSILYSGISVGDVMLGEIKEYKV